MMGGMLGFIKKTGWESVVVFFFFFVFDDVGAVVAQDWVPDG